MSSLSVSHRNHATSCRWKRSDSSVRHNAFRFGDISPLPGAFHKSVFYTDGDSDSSGVKRRPIIFHLNLFSVWGLWKMTRRRPPPNGRSRGCPPNGGSRGCRRHKALLIYSSLLSMKPQSKEIHDSILPPFTAPLSSNSRRCVLSSRENDEMNVVRSLS